MKLLCKLLFIFFIIAVFDYGWAATYYVDYAGGSDSDNGISTVAPFKYSPGDANCSSVCASKTLSPGDKVIFKGGVVYIGTILIKWSGSGDTDAGRIIYDGDSGTYVSRWGSGTAKAIIDGGGTQNYLFSWSAAKSYIKINNFELRNGAHVSNQGRLIYNASASTYVTVSNNTIHDAGSKASPETLSGVGVMSLNGDHWKIFNNAFYDCYDTGISLISGNTNFEIYNNTFTAEMNWAMYIKPEYANSSGIDIYNNTFFDQWAHPSCPDCHGNGIFLNNTTTYTLSSVTIRNNLFYNSTTLTGDPQQTAIVHVESGASTGTIVGTKIYNNVFSNPNSYFAVSFYDGYYGDVSIYNNSFNSPKGYAFLYLTAGLSTVDGVAIKGNSLKTSADVLIYKTGTFTNIAIDYNNYYTGGTAVAKVNGSYYNWTGWKGLGFDANGRGSASNPKYISADATHWNLSIPSDSPLKAAFPTAQAPTGMFTTDFTGTTRPVGTAWDIGAYKSGSFEDNKPKPPRNLRINAQ